MHVNRPFGKKEEKSIFAVTVVAFVCSVLFTLVRVLCPYPLGLIVFVAEFVDVVSCLHCISCSGTNLAQIHHSEKRAVIRFW